MTLHFISILLPISFLMPFVLTFSRYTSDKHILYCRVITKRIQQLKILDTETETSSEDDDTETDEGYADAEYSNTSSEEEEEEDE